MSAKEIMNKKTYPVILCGGNGSRLWPLSRADRPKQFLKLMSDKTMLQDTLLRVQDRDLYHPPIIVSDAEFEHVIRDQLADIDVEPEMLILEPFGRNTAPAITLAALAIGKQDPNAQLLVLPADHAVANPRSFQHTLATALSMVATHAIVTLGACPDRAETGYGYIRRGEPVGDSGTCFKVDSFIEKPDVLHAKDLLNEGNNFWNCGIFLFEAKAYLKELHAHAPNVLAQCINAIEAGVAEIGIIRPDPVSFANAPSISIDHAVMEHTSEGLVVTADFGWADVGSWQAFAKARETADETDTLGNFQHGDVLTTECAGVHAVASDRLVVAVGLKDLVIVDTPDALLVVAKDHAQSINAVVDQLALDGRSEAVMNRKVHRPWGSFEGVHWGARHQVKQITVGINQKLSLQYHHHRSEHWTITSGTAEVTVDDEKVTLSQDNSIYIPLGSTHRIHNIGKIPVELIEVQIGDYLGEDDIVRLEDIYGRTKNPTPVKED